MSESPKASGAEDPSVEQSLDDADLGEVTGGWGWRDLGRAIDDARRNLPGSIRPGS